MPRLTALALTPTFTLKPLALALAFGLAGCSATTDLTAGKDPELELIGRYASGQHFVSAAEIVGYHAASQRILVVNAESGRVDLIDASTLKPEALVNPLSSSNLVRAGQIDPAVDLPEQRLGAANSLAVKGDLLAVAVEAADKQARGIVALYDLAGASPRFIEAVTVGSLPDMVTFSPDGQYLLVANEGEPSADYRIDPEGSVSIIAVQEGRLGEVRTVGFAAFNTGGPRADELHSQVRIFGRNASVAQDLEPEYITVSTDSKTAFVSLQENNALARIDIEAARVEAILPLGYKDYGQHPIDASDKDKAVNLHRYPGVLGMYQPDSIASYSVAGVTYIVTANEGDARDYWFDAPDAAACTAAGGLEFDREDGCLGYSEETRAGKLPLSEPLAAAAADKAALGRLKVTDTLGKVGDQYQALYSFGARSFSIWDEEGALVFDSGSDFERISAAQLGIDFNNDNDENKGDSRSDDKGPEPEALTLGEINGHTYAFIGLERTGGIMTYEITNPAAPRFISYQVNRQFDLDIEAKPDQVGDLGPEGMTFVPADKSPIKAPLLIVGNEVSGTTSVYRIK